jgi:uncharacterized membrane protein
MIVPVPYVHAGMGLLIASFAIPLIMRKVPMNRVYGIRVRKAFVSNENWYELNAYGGKLFLAFGLFLLVFTFLAKDVAPPPTSIWAPVFLAGPLVLIVPVLALVNAFARRLPER